MWALIGMAVLQGVSSIMQGKSQARQMATQAGVSRFNTAQALRDAKTAQRDTDFAQTRHAIQGAKEMGTLRVAQAASGARLDVGAPFTVRTQALSEMEMDNALIGMEGRAQVSKYKSEADIGRLQTSLFRKGARSAFMSGIMGAGAAGFQAASFKKLYPKTPAAKQHPYPVH